MSCAVLMQLFLGKAPENNRVIFVTRVKKYPARPAFLKGKYDQ
jgi:hypothetical protein